MRITPPRSAVAAAILVTLGWSANSHEATASAKVYREQFLSLQSSLQAVLDRASVAVSQGEGQRDALAEELLATVKLVHRLGEEAASTNLESVRHGGPHDRGLLFVSQGCEGMSFVVAALQNFVATRDRTFLSLARDGMELVRSAGSTFVWRPTDTIQRVGTCELCCLTASQRNKPTTPTGAVTSPLLVHGRADAADSGL